MWNETDTSIHTFRGERRPILVPSPDLAVGDKSEFAKWPRIGRSALSYLKSPSELFYTHSQVNMDHYISEFFLGVGQNDFCHLPGDPDAHICLHLYAYARGQYRRTVRDLWALRSSQTTGASGPGQENQMSFQCISRSLGFMGLRGLCRIRILGSDDDDGF